MKKALQSLLPLTATLLMAVAPGCVAPRTGSLPPSNPPLPSGYPGSDGGTNAPIIGWQDFFQDPVLVGLISHALTNNQELNILFQEMAAAKAGVQGRKGALFPFVRLGGSAGMDKVGAHTRNGAVEENLEIKPGRKFPEPLPNFAFAADFDWEVDVWRKLRNERDAAIQHYLATGEGRNFAATQLISEIAKSYYELLSLDSLLEIYGRMLSLQEQALESVRLKKAAARVTELAVRRFEAEVLKNRSRLFEIQQRIVETENRLNELAGRYPKSIPRTPLAFGLMKPGAIEAGVPSDILRNRPDIRQAEAELKAAGLEVKAAAARFYPALNLSAVLGLESFTLGSPILAKENLAYGATANLVGPLINRSAIQAAFKGASAHQIAAVYRFQQTVLKAYVEVVNELSRIRNVAQGVDFKSKQVDALQDSASMSIQLFNSARADYTEVLLTQREALEARVELVEMKQSQLIASVMAYKALGGGVIQSPANSDPTRHEMQPAKPKTK